MIKTRMKILRTMYGMTQEDLAGKVRVSRQTINAIEQGKYPPSLDLAFRIAKLFETRIDDVFHYEGE